MKEKVMLTCVWCGEQFEHGYPGDHNDQNHVERHLRIREVYALESIAESLTKLRAVGSGGDGVMYQESELEHDLRGSVEATERIFIKLEKACARLVNIHKLAQGMPHVLNTYDEMRVERCIACAQGQKYASVIGRIGSKPVHEQGPSLIVCEAPDREEYESELRDMIDEFRGKILAEAGGGE